MHQLQGHAALFFIAARQVMHTAQAEHLRAVFRRGHMADFFTVVQHRSAFITQIAVGINLHFEAAIAEDAFGHHGHHVHALRARGHDKRCRLVIGVSGGCAYAGDKHAALLAIAWGHGLRHGVCISTRQQGLCVAERSGLAIQPNHRVQTHQHTLVVGVAVTSADTAFGNLAEHRARIAFHLALANRTVLGLDPLQAQGQAAVSGGQSIGVCGAGCVHASFRGLNALESLTHYAVGSDGSKFKRKHSGEVTWPPQQSKKHQAKLSSKT